MSSYGKPRSLFVPLLLVTAGVFILLINIGTLEGTTWENLTKYWPVILILAGLDGLYKRDGWVGPLVLLGLGTILMLGNLHYLPTGAWPLFIRLWPVLLVAIGLDIAFSRRDTAWNTVFRISLGLLLVAAITWLAISSPFATGVKTQAVKQGLDGAAASSITFTLPVGNLNLSGGAPSGQLISGEAGLPKNMVITPKYTKPSNGRSEFTLDGGGVVFLPANSMIPPWKFQVNSSIPIDIKASIGVGKMSFDFSGTTGINTEAKMAVGSMDMVLPCETDSEVSLALPVGIMNLKIPEGCDVKLNLDTGLTFVDLPDNYSRNDNSVLNREATASGGKLKLDVELAVGSLSIQELR